MSRVAESTVVVAAGRWERQRRTAAVWGFLAVAVAMVTGSTLLPGLLAWQRSGLVLAALLPLAGAAWVLSRGERRRRSGSHRQTVHLTLPAYGTLLIMTVLFAGSLLGRSNPLMLVAAMLAGPFVVNGWLTFSMLRGIEVSRRVRPRAGSGDPVWVDVELANHKRWLTSWLMTVRDRVESEHDSFTAEVLFHRVPRRGSRTARYRLRLSRRGRYTIGPATVSTGFPLDFVRRSRLIDDTSEVLVHPRVGRLSGSWSRQLRSADAASKQHVSRADTSADEFQRLREYRFGDSLRKIHWRTSARKNELMVREDRQRQRQTYAVLVDLWQPAQPSEEQLDRVEWAVSMAASLCVAQLQAHRDGRVTVAIAGEQRQRWEGRSGPAGVEALLDELAVVRAGEEADPAALFALADEDRPVSTVMVTTRSREELDELLAGADDARRTRRRGEVLVVEATPEEASRMLISN